jgi:hypothetical protein
MNPSALADSLELQILYANKCHSHRAVEVSWRDVLQIKSVNPTSFVLNFTSLLQYNRRLSILIGLLKFPVVYSAMSMTPY